MQETEQLVESLALELRRGAVILAALSRLEEPQYGYYLVQALQKKGFPIEPGTLYPLLRRLENQGLLESSWNTGKNRPRKYYRLSEEGKRVYEALRGEWKSLVEQINRLIDLG
ncbi:MAG: PadR family transcriptional regulator [Bacillota bacterium]